MDTMTRIMHFFADKHGFSEEALKPGVTLESLGLDSLDKIEFLFALEEEFRIRIDERAKTIATLADLAELIDAALAEQAVSGARGAATAAPAAAEAGGGR